MSVVCPTVTAVTRAEYRQQLERIQSFARRIHLDFMDGVFAPTKSISIAEAWWQPGPVIDLHVMHQKPMLELEHCIMLQPHMIILHAESEGILDFFKEIDDLGIKKGLAILQPTSVDSIKELLPELDHVLVFSGDLGHFGGTVDMHMLEKVKELKRLKPSLEIGWDGGINAENAAELIRAGVDVLNTGGFIQRAQNPEDAYDTLEAIVKAEATK